MSTRSDEEADEVYHHDDDPYHDSDTTTGESESPAPYLPAAPWGWLPFRGSRAESEEEYRDGPYEEGAYDEDDSSSGLWGLWDESLITLLIVGGAILFLFPEPATSAFGILLMGVGVFAWIVDWAT